MRADHGHGPGNLLPIDEPLDMDRNLIEHGEVGLSCRGGAALGEENQEHSEDTEDRRRQSGRR